MLESCESDELRLLPGGLVGDLQGLQQLGSLLDPVVDFRPVLLDALEHPLVLDDGLVQRAFVSLNV